MISGEDHAHTIVQMATCSQAQAQQCYLQGCFCHIKVLLLVVVGNCVPFVPSISILCRWTLTVWCQGAVTTSSRINWLSPYMPLTWHLRHAAL